ncbi:gluconokinase [Brytella acorum]|uniref:Gluconokinase n=1 Tax=Brytella acorum TaxID=2959299 RepID=A0AA35VAL7_9PROT|nr:gluconokinase [Brytella acorum]MDF3623877.1 gluconokinase [Brytella acorum]CAI9120793.1 gluconokinase [Brytella acorum]
MNAPSGNAAVAADQPHEPRLLIVMGVSGVGKTTIAMDLAKHFGWPFQEGDNLHPPENVAKMASGTPLTDEDRGPWLRKCHAWLEDHARTGGVLTCSALKRAYRDMLRDGLPVVFVYLYAPTSIIQDRLVHRKGHYMPASLLKSQLDTLEPPGADEPVITIDSENGEAYSVEAVIAQLAMRPA